MWTHLLSKIRLLANEEQACQSNHLHRYSSRLPWTAPVNVFSVLLEQRRRAGVPLLDLSISNPTEAFSCYPHSGIRQAYGELTNFLYQPEPLGQRRAREQISNWYRERDLDIAPANLVLTASTSEAYALLFKLLTDPGDEVLIPAPSYPLFEHLARLESIKLQPYRLRYDGCWHIDFEDVTRAISERSRAIILVNPNNPTGSFLKRWEAELLFATAASQNLPLIADEVFMDFAFTPSADRVSSFIGHNEVLNFSLNGLSKSAGMPQMKLAWMGVNGPAVERQAALQRLELLLDTYLSVATPVQAALGDLLRIGGQIKDLIVQRIKENRANLRTVLAGSAVHVLNGEGGWSAILQVPNIHSEEVWITRILKECGVIVQPGYFFDMETEAYLVVSLITSPDVLAEGITRIAHLLQRTR